MAMRSMGLGLGRVLHLTCDVPKPDPGIFGCGFDF
jgi:hypothetical protein